MCVGSGQIYQKAACIAWDRFLFPPRNSYYTYPRYQVPGSRTGLYWYQVVYAR